MPSDASRQPANSAEDRFLRAHEQLAKEIADLRLIVAALVLVVTDDAASAELCEAHDRVAGWAMSEFDLDLLREILAEYGPPALNSRLLPPNKERQQELFAAGDEAAPAAVTL